MSEEEKRVPELRFKDFIDDWEQRKLGELCRIGDIDHRMPTSVSVGIPYVMTGDFIGNNDIDFENAKRISEEDYEQLAKKIKPEKGDILFARYASVGTVRYVETNQKFLISYSCAILKPNEDIEGKYLYFYIQTGSTQQRIELEINTGSQRNIGIDSLKNNIAVLVPKIDEQSKIGTFFKQLDDTIALHQRKLTLLKQLKQTYLHVMLPQNEGNSPALRFAGFSETWEQRKLGDLAESFEYGLNASATNYDGENKYIRITDIDESSHLFLQGNLTSPDMDLSNSNNHLLGARDILFARTGASVGKSYQYDISDGKVYFAGFLIRARIRKECNSSFIFQNTLTSNYQNFIKITSQRSGQPGVNAQEYATFSLVIPSKKEQDQVGSLFEQIDKTVVLHQKKIAHLKCLKSTLLNKMFI